MVLLDLQLEQTPLPLAGWWYYSASIDARPPIPSPSPTRGEGDEDAASPRTSIEPDCMALALSGTVQIGAALSSVGYGPDTAGQRAPGTTCTSKISSTPVTNSRCATSRPVPRSTTPTPHFSSARFSAIGIPPKVEVSRIFDRPTKAKRS